MLKDSLQKKSLYKDTEQKSANQTLLIQKPNNQLIALHDESHQNYINNEMQLTRKIILGFYRKKSHRINDAYRYNSVIQYNSLSSVQEWLLGCF